MSAQYSCAYCGEIVDTWVDPGGGEHQELIEDCAVCCRPNVLTIDVDLATGEARVTARYEG